MKIEPCAKCGAAPEMCVEQSMRDAMLGCEKPSCDNMTQWFPESEHQEFSVITQWNHRQKMLRQKVNKKSLWVTVPLGIAWGIASIPRLLWTLIRPGGRIK